MVRLLAALCALLLPGLALAQDVVPDSRVAISRNVDFYGSDLANIFDTTLDACQAACLANDACTAFTYNQRSGACFPKSGITEVQSYDGAVSARIFRTDPAVLAGAAEAAAQLDFLLPEDFSAARNLGQDIGRLHASNENTAESLAATAESRTQGGDLYGALLYTGAAIALNDAPDLWTAYSTLARTAAIADGSERSRVRGRAVPAAVNGFLRAEGPVQTHDSLVALARALEDDGRGRQMIDALRLAQDAEFRRDTDVLLNDVIGKYGFRVTGTDVESDSARPRICAQMSEDLVQAGIDYAPYVQLPDSALTVDAEGQQICVDGVDHGARYRIVLRAGLPAASGEALIRPVELNFYVRDRSPSVRFSGNGYVLPRAGDAALPVETVNVSEVALDLFRVSDRNLVRAMQEDLFARPLYSWQADFFEDQIGTPVWQGTAEVDTELNVDMGARLPLAEAIEGQEAGVYVLQARVPDADPDESPAATQWFALTDLGLATMQGTDGLTVVVRSLADAGAATGAEVTLISQANDVLGTALTDADGVVRFAPGLVRGTGAAAPSLVTVSQGDDMAFLSLTGPAFDLSDRGVAGRQPSPPIDVFLATDRGAYRAGETIHVTALMRDESAAAIPGVPLTAILTRPDGVEYSRHVSTDGAAGGHVFALPVAASAPRGVWSVALHTDVEAPALVSDTVLVEDFLPERIDVDLDLPKVLAPGDAATLGVQADYLFGAPATGLDIEGDVLLRAAAGLEQFPGYRFGLYDEPVSPRALGLGGGWQTDETGAALVDLPFPDIDAPGRPLSLEVTARVQELSGRPVERVAIAELRPATDMIGIRPAFDGVLPEGTEARFDVIGLSPRLEPAPMEVVWTINRVRTDYTWYSVGGRWNWEPVTTRERIATGDATLGDGPLRIAAPVDWGRHELIVERTDGAYLASSVDFHAGWYAPADASETPDLLEVSLDAESYAPGDTAMLRVVPRFAGTAVVTVLTNRVVHLETAQVGAGESLIPLAVTEDWGAGAYVTVSVLRPMDADQGRNPARALGLAHAAVVPGMRALDVAIEAPETTRPRQPLEVAVRVDGVADGETAHVTLAAVDVGILNLTGFDSPDPSGHYFGQRKLGIEMRDLYGRLIDGMTGAMGTVRSGGDGGAVSTLGAPPPTEDLVTFFRGPVTVEDGVARATLDLPGFNGTLRLMAIAWSETGVGQAEAEVLVRDPVVVTVTVPRFMAPGDEALMRIEVTHADGPTGPVELAVDSDGVLLKTPRMRLGAPVEQGTGFSRQIPIVAQGPGDHGVTVTATAPDGTELARTVTIPVRRNDPEITRTSRFALAAGGTFTFDDQVFAGFAPGTGHATISAGPLSRFDAPGLLALLDRYPYGCTEQIASQAMPLLYFDSVAVAMGLGNRNGLATRVDEAITAILGRQARNGAFGLWGPHAGDLWLDAYVTDFLARARARGHDVPDLAFETALDNLRNRVNYYPDFDEGAEDLAYALLVLAREGAAAIGDLRYYADEKAKAFGSPLAAAQLGAALAQYGEQARADALFAQASSALTGRLASDEATDWRVDYGTNRRDAAAVLTLALEAGSTAVDTDRLADVLGQPGRASTQEAAWTLMAANALIDDLRDTGLTVDGSVPDGPVVHVREAGTRAAPLLFEAGEDETELTLTTFGVPEVPEPPGGNGWGIERTYFTMEGEPASPDGIAVGTRLVTVITARPFGFREARLMIDDPLPAGFEIDNPNLLRSGDLSGLAWLETVEPENAEFRSDRFLAAVDWRSDAAFRLAYVVRAVSRGTFHHPAVSLEDMYRPEMRAHGATGRIAVAE